MNRDYSITLAIAERAAEWLERLPTASATEREECLAWLRESPVHVRELLLAVRCAEWLQSGDPEGQIDVQAFIAKARTVTHSPFDSHLQRTVAPRVMKPSKPHWKLAACMSVLTLIALLTFSLVNSWPNRTIVTGMGEWRTETLMDGSIVKLGPRTRVELRFEDDRRVIHLPHGEATFRVAKDRERPFMVSTTAGVVARALGTEFGVSYEKGAVIVTVAEGTVAVIEGDQRWLASARNANWAVQRESKDVSTTLRPNQQAQIAPGSAVAVKDVDAAKELAWADGWLIFERGDTVAHAIEEYNRRNRVQIEVADPAFAARAVSGGFKAADPESFALAIAGSGNMSITREKDRLRIEPRG